ncbi:MAG: hypothetical protein ACREFB_19765, partial [Stellaceae bacterium]
RYFDDNDKPAMIPTLGYATAKFGYDAAGNLVEGQWFDTDGRPTAPKGIRCTHIVLTYIKGRVASRVCRDPPAPTAPKG